MADLVDLTENRQSELRATTIAITILAVFFVILRFLSRRMKGIGIGADDIMILVALVSSSVRCCRKGTDDIKLVLFATMASCLIGVHYGMGMHAAALTTPQIVSYAKVILSQVLEDR